MEFRRGEMELDEGEGEGEGEIEYMMEKVYRKRGTYPIWSVCGLGIVTCTRMST